MSRPTGRPTKLSPELQEAICDALRRGAYIETAAALAGVATSTLHAWLREGARAEDGPLAEFSEACARACAEAEVGALATIDAAAKGGDWRAAAWRLERQHPRRWASKDRVKVETTTPSADNDDAQWTENPLEGRA